MSIAEILRFSLLSAVLATSPLRAASGQTPDDTRFPLPALDQALQRDLVSYLKNNHTRPEEYVIGKFKDHQIVFIGEYHRIRHDVQLIQRLVPLLYEAGIYYLGIEFGVHRDQDRVDKHQCPDDAWVKNVSEPILCYYETVPHFSRAAPAAAQAAQQARHLLQSMKNTISLLVIIVALWLPRSQALDRFVTPDEPKWLMRSANFYLALAQGDLGSTYQKEHPGVTAMWAGLAGFLRGYPQYIKLGPGQMDSPPQLERYLENHGVEALALLATSRRFIVIAIVIALSLAISQRSGWSGSCRLWLAFCCSPLIHS